MGLDINIGIVIPLPLDSYEKGISDKFLTEINDKLIDKKLIKNDRLEGIHKVVIGKIWWKHWYIHQWFMNNLSGSMECDYCSLFPLETFELEEFKKVCEEIIKDPAKVGKLKLDEEERNDFEIDDLKDIVKDIDYLFKTIDKLKDKSVWLEYQASW